MKPSGIGLGISEVDHFKEHLDEVTIDLEENDTIVLYTDGITEAKNENLEDFGEKYFTEILLENRNNIVDEISKKVIQEVTMFSHNHSQYDDITLVILKWKSRQSEEGRTGQAKNFRRRRISLWLKIKLTEIKNGRIQHINCR